MALFKKYSVLISWLVVLGGFVGIFTFFGASFLWSFLALLVINLVLRIISYLLHYQDGKYIFQIGYYFTLFALFTLVIIEGGAMQTFFDLFTLVWVFHLGVTGFIVYVLGTHRKIDAYMYYKLLILFVGMLFLIVLRNVPNIYHALLIDALFLSGIYGGLYYIIKHKPPTDQEVKNISVRRILAGERITQYKSNRSPFWTFLYEFIDQQPLFTKYMLEFINIIPVLVLMGIYIYSFFAHTLDFHQLIYWLIIIVFVCNVVVLKKIGYTSTIQKVVLFGTINFAIYISLFYFFAGSIGNIARWGIVWNIVGGLLLFYLHRLPGSDIFKQTDYTYWLVITILAMVLNITLLLYTGLPGGLLFSLIILYVGLESMILVYGMRYIQKLELIN